MHGLLFSFRWLRRRGDAIRILLPLAAAGWSLTRLETNALFSLVLLVSVLFIAHDLTRLVASEVARPANLHVMEAREVRQRLGEVALPSHLVDKGYSLSGDPLLLRSDLVDMFMLNGGDWPLERAERSEAVGDLLRKHGANLRVVLRSQLRHARRSTPAVAFLNERKVALLDDPFAAATSLKVAPTDYYTTFLTNDASVRVVRDRKNRALFDGFEELYPTGTDASTERKSLLSLEATRFGNHIGASVLAITRDRQLVLWRQGATAAQARNRWVPTGSGSADPTDFQGVGGLLEGVRRTMARELREEARWRSTGVPIGVEPDQILIFGYFRNLERGGKPDFAGLVRIDETSSDLNPWLKELTDEKKLADIGDIDDLRQACMSLMHRVDSSTVLAACADSLIRAIDSHPDRVEVVISG